MIIHSALHSHTLPQMTKLTKNQIENLKAFESNIVAQNHLADNGIITSSSGFFSGTTGFAFNSRVVKKLLAMGLIERVALNKVNEFGYQSVYQISDSGKKALAENA